MRSSAAPAPPPSGGNPHLATATESWGEREAPVAVLAVHGRRTQSPADMRALAEQLAAELATAAIPDSNPEPVSRESVAELIRSALRGDDVRR